MKLSQLFQKCLLASYHHVENDGDYALQREGDTLYLLLQWSNCQEDWINNFDFPAQPYNDMASKWKAHRGFLRVWKSIEPYIAEAIADPTLKEITVVGYSHGAALAVLAHEYVWFHRPDIRDNCYGFGFEGPRVICAPRECPEIKERWKNFTLIRNGHDLVTHVPPRIMGFIHVGELIEVGQKRDNVIMNRKLKCVSEHYTTNVLNSLIEYEEEQEKQKEQEQ